MITQHQIYILQIQNQAVPGSDPSLPKSNCVNLGLNPINVPIDVTYDIDNHT